MQMRWLPLRGQKKNKKGSMNNQGSMLLMVIMIIAILMILITMLYAMGILNFKMKYTDRTAKDTFYDAESALDEIKAGLQLEISDSITSAYVLTMESYSMLTEEERDAQFSSEYVRNLREAVREPGDSSKYSLANLNGYLTKTKYDDSSQTGAKVESANNVLRVTDKGVILEDVEVTYYGEGDYVSYIRTDIVLNFPDMEFSQASVVPQLTTYSMIANQQFTATGTKADIEGNVYWGKSGANGGTVIENSAITLKKSSESSNRATMITGGDILLNNNASFTADEVELWARNIEVVGSRLNISGASYLQDDLVVGNIRGSNGMQVPSSIIVSGDYYGYGNPATAKLASSALAEAIDDSPADYSSAILVNGTRTKVDLSGLNTLMLSGNSYIQATGQQSGVVSGITNKDTVMGESLSVKSSQTAYLVPTVCVAPNSENGSINPMTSAQYEELVEELGEGNLVDFHAVVPEYGDSLSSMGINDYQPVYYRLNNDVSIVYLFMKFDTQTDANRFFERYYSIAKNKSALDSKLDVYTSEITLPDINVMADNTQFYYNGNILVNDSSTDSFYINKLQSVTSEEQSYLSSSQIEYQDNYAALNKKLIKNYNRLTAAERSSDVYGNLVNGFSYADSKYNIPAGDHKIFVSAGTDNCAAVVVNGDYTIDSNRISGTDAEGNSISDAELCVVISSGDVIVKSDFNGLILARGTITVENRANGSSGYQLKAAPTKVAIALSAQNSEGVMASYYIKDAASMVNGVNDNGSGADGTGGISISDLISYDNWKKN